MCVAAFFSIIIPCWSYSDVFSSDFRPMPKAIPTG